MIDTIKTNSSYYARKVENALEAAKVRALTTMQKVQFINTYVLPKLTYVSRIFKLEKSALKRINQMTYKFIWRHNLEKLAWKEIINPVKEGGMGAIDLETKCNALFLKTSLKHLFQDPPSIETRYLDYFIGLSLAKFKTPLKGPHAESTPQCLSNTMSLVSEITDLKPDQNLQTMTAKDICKLLVNKITLRPKILKKNENNQLFYECCKTLNTQILTPNTKDVNFLRIHNILTTKYSLYKCNQSADEKCKWCGDKEDAKHLIECPASLEALRWLRLKTLDHSRYLKPSNNDFFYLNLPPDKPKLIILTAEWHRALFMARKANAKSIVETVIQKLEKKRKIWEPGKARIKKQKHE